MRVLSIEEAASVVGEADVGAFFAAGGWQYPDPVPWVWTPRDSGAKVNPARILARIFLENGRALLWVTGAGIWESAEHRDLFTGYRRSIGELRSVADAPLHLFEPSDEDAFISILAIGLFFFWDVEIVALDHSLAVTVSHDEWFEWRVGGNSLHLLETVGAILRPYERGRRAGETTPSSDE